MSAAVVLASGSPRRREILAEIGVAFRVEPSRALEPMPRALDGPDIARAAASLSMGLAFAKAKEVARRTTLGDVVVAADTIVVLPEDGRVLGKPTDADDARLMLDALAGREHLVVTGIVAIETARGRIADASSASRVVMSPRGDARFRRWLASGAWAGKAGAYGIQDEGAPVAGCEGSVSNVVGLDAIRAAEILASAGVDVSCARADRLEARFRSGLARIDA